MTNGAPTTRGAALYRTPSQPGDAPAFASRVQDGSAVLVRAFPQPPADVVRDAALEIALVERPGRWFDDEFRTLGYELVNGVDDVFVFPGGVAGGTSQTSWVIPSCTSRYEPGVTSSAYARSSFETCA